MKKYLFVLTAAVFLLSGCENNNIYSWSHSAGGDSSPEALLADGQKAESDGDYKKAIEYYDEILKKDSDNSEALYGKASAELKNAGLDLAEIVPKLLQGEDEAGAAAESFLKDINFSDLEKGSLAAFESLKQIADGQGDGTIPADDFDVNLNAGVAKTVHTVSKLLNWGQESGVVDIKDDYSVVVDETKASTDTIKAKLVETKADVEEAVKYLDKAARESGTDVGDVKKGFDDLIANLDKKIDELQ